MINYCKCGSIKIGKKCTNKNCPEMKSRRRTWLIKGDYLTFGEPVTYQEANEAADKIQEYKREIRSLLRIY